MKQLKQVFQASEMVKFVFAGGLAFVVDIAVLNLVVNFFSVHYLVANGAGFAAGLIVSYLLSIKWVFNGRRYETELSVEFPVFVAIVGFGFLLSQSLMWFLIDGIALVDYLAPHDVLEMNIEQVALNVAKVASAVIVTVFNFVAKKLLLFSPKN